MLCEPVWGFWFHLLESGGESTINKFLRVMVEQAGKVRKESNNRNEPDHKIESPGLTLHICVLKHEFSLQKNILFPFSEAEFDSQLNVNLQGSVKELEQVRELNGWKLNGHTGNKKGSCAPFYSTCNVLLLVVDVHRDFKTEVDVAVFRSLPVHLIPK